MSGELITIDAAGNVRFIYSDELAAGLADLGPREDRRASHVEPAGGGKWDADMRPSRGPASLGPFDTRAAALSAEVEWLKQNNLGA